jgi:hypothetical protein
MPKRNPYGYNKGASPTVVETPAPLLEAAAARWGAFAWDLAAFEDNKKAPRCITPDEDSLSPNTPWPLDELCWLNPPYDDIAPWVRKCDGYVRAYGERFECLQLIPARIGSNWYRDYCFGKCETIPLNIRPQFIGYDSGAGVDHMILRFGGANNTLTMLEPWDFEAAWARL